MARDEINGELSFLDRFMYASGRYDNLSSKEIQYQIKAIKSRLGMI